MITKKELFKYMSEIYQEKFNDSNSYVIFKEILEMTDPKQLKELAELLNMDEQQRLKYRYALSSVALRELTPHQVDQYLSVVEYALEHKLKK